MINKLSLTKQLIILFSSVILLSTIIFGILIYNRLSNIYRQENNNRLTQFIYASKGFWGTNNINLESGQDIEYMTGITNLSREIYISKNALSLLNDSELNQLYHSCYRNQIPNLPQVGTFQAKSGEIFYVAEFSENRFIIAFNDNTYIKRLIFKTEIQVVIIFGAIMMIGNALIIYWSRYIVRRIKRIQQDVINLPKDNYERPVKNAGRDEIGSLANSIEKMRQAIFLNESTKKEMLQNLSHDFKTPIAVIKSYSEAIIDGIEDQEGAKVILRQSEILKNKVNKLLQLNKLEYINQNKNFEKVNVKEVINNVIKQIKYQTNIEIILNLEEVYFLGFIENYYTIIENILDNALRYAKTLIKITLKEKQIIIYNDGEPIEDYFIENSFKPYEKGSDGEFGLGMSIVVKTLKIFNLKLKCSNEYNGVSFIIYQDW